MIPQPMVRLVTRAAVGIALVPTGILVASACRGPAPREQGRPKLVILGFDGMDPALLDDG